MTKFANWTKLNRFMNWTESSHWLSLIIKNSQHILILLATVTLLNDFRRFEIIEDSWTTMWTSLYKSLKFIAMQLVELFTHNLSTQWKIIICKSLWINLITKCKCNSRLLLLLRVNELNSRIESMSESFFWFGSFKWCLSSQIRLNDLFRNWRDSWIELNHNVYSVSVNSLLSLRLYELWLKCWSIHHSNAIVALQETWTVARESYGFPLLPFLTVLEVINWLLCENVHNIKLFSHPSHTRLVWHEGE